ncbi:MAG: hypothetical protein ACJ8DE_04200 [Microvirga sp.]
MDNALWWIIDIIGPAILLIVLISLVMRSRSGKTGRTEQATDQLYREEERRRREGTDAAED